MTRIEGIQSHGRDGVTNDGASSEARPEGAHASSGSNPPVPVGEAAATNLKTVQALVEALRQAREALQNARAHMMAWQGNTGDAIHTAVMRDNADALAALDARLKLEQEAQPTRRPQDWLLPTDERAYQCRCADCSAVYIGEKRSQQCRKCAAHPTSEPDGLGFYLGGPYHDGTYSICEVATGRVRHIFNPATDDHHIEGSKYNSLEESLLAYILDTLCEVRPVLKHEPLRERVTAAINGMTYIINRTRRAARGVIRSPAPDAHELWAAAQLTPGEGIEDGVARIQAILDGVGLDGGKSDE